MILRGVREAIHDATALHLRAPTGLDVIRLGTRVDTSSRGSANGLIVDAIESGRILSTIDRQPSPVRCWLLYAYGAVPDGNHKAFLARDLHRRLFQEATKRESKRARLRALCRVSIDDMKMRLNNGRRLPIVYMAATIEINENKFRRDYVRLLKTAQQALQEYDASGLSSVRETLDILRNGRRRGAMRG